MNVDVRFSLLLRLTDKTEIRDRRIRLILRKKTPNENLLLNSVDMILI